jgi:MoxR-like ATPase
VPVLQDKFAALEGALEGELVDRADEIRCASLALVAGCTYFMVGPPGVAKSLLARRVAARITDAEFFDCQLDKMATPEVLFGPWSLGAMRKNRWERELDRTLATAHLAHIDEVFAAGSTLLQGLHWALNERIYRHGTTVIDLPLSTVFCSANQVPTDSGLAAFWDRLILRRALSAELDAGDFVAMLRTELEDKPAPVLSWSEITEAQVAARRVEVPDVVGQTVYGIRRRLIDVGIFPSPRRFHAAMGVVRAAAWLDGRDVAESTDLLVLKDILWLFPEQAVTVAQLVDRELRNSLSPTVLLLKELRRLKGQIVDGLPDARRLDLAEELGVKLSRMSIEMDVLARVGSSSTLAQCRRVFDEVNELILVRLLHSDPAAVS